jgi:hypothetical protein
MKENNCKLSDPEIQLTIEIEKMVENNCILRTPEVQLTIELENSRRQLQSVKSEVQLQLNLTT